MAMAKKGAFKPGLFNFYVVQAPRRDNPDVLTLGIHVSNGRKRDNFDSIPFTFDGKAHFAALGQHQCDTEAAVRERYEEYKTLWIKPYDVSPLKEQDKPA
jgi:hypothetical protein